MQIKLQEVKDCPGRLIDTAGRPIVQAKIRPVSWMYTRRGENFHQELIFLHEQLSDELTAETADDGSFNLHNVPVIGRISVKVLAKGFGEPLVIWNVEKPVVVQLGRAGNIRGSITCLQDPDAAADIKLALNAKIEPQTAMDADMFISYLTGGVTQQDGGFQFADVPPGQYEVIPQLPETSPYFCESGGPIAVKSDETAAVSLALKPAVKLQGKVVDQETGEGVAGVHVSLYFNDARDAGGRSNSATTDQAGAFTIYTRQGKAIVNFWQIPDQYLNPSDPRQQRTVDLKEDTVMDPIRLTRASGLEGIVVDTAGNPVADAEIRFMDPQGMLSPHEIIRSDAAGKFTLKKITPKQPIVIRARAKNAVADPVNVVPAELKEPVRVVVDDKKSFTMRGIVADEGGKPLPQIAVGLISHWSTGSGGISFQSETCKTDDAGKFAFIGLLPGDQYEIRIKAQGFEQYGTRQIDATPGGVRDFGKIALVGAGGAVEGSVQDSAGKPVAYARVFNTGDGPEPVETRSDDAGRFRLQGFRSGPVFVLAEKEGYRFAGLRTNAGASGAVVKMLRSDEPLPQRPAPSAASISEDELKSARLLVEKFLAEGTDVQKQWARRTMPKIERLQSGKAPDDTKIKSPNPSDINSLKKVAEEDLEEAFSLIAKQGSRSYISLIQLAKHFAASDPEKAMRSAEEAVVRARSLDQPERTAALARTGALVMLLGKTQAGQKLVDEAAEMAGKMQPSERNYYVFSTVAGALAPSDLSRAKGLMDKISDKNRRDYYVAEVAGSLDNIEQAESLLKDIEPFYAQRARMELAYRIAAKRPAEAVRLVENTPTQRGNEEDTKAKAYGWLATAIAPGDPVLAHSLIDRAFAIYRKPADRFSGGRGGRAAQAAVLAVEADQIAYPDMQSVVYRVLATRSTTKDAWSPAAVNESSMMMALYLALIDPPTARQILQSLEPTSETIGSGYSGVLRIEWFKAWGLVDPQHAAELLQRKLATAQEKRAKQDAENAVYETVELWLTPPGERLNNISMRYRDMLSPREELYN